MINIAFSERNFEYDVHSLVKSFFPQEDIVMKWPQEFSAPADFDTYRDSAMLLVDYLENNEIRVRARLENGCFEGCERAKSAERIDNKNCVKSLLYRVLSEALDLKLPWGNLTGIRPTRLAMQHLEEGYSHSETVKYMKDNYFVSEEKSLLAADIAQRERDTIRRLIGDTKEDLLKGYSLYVGIPFCPTTCLYCSFASNPIGAAGHMVLPYLAALEKELSVIAPMYKDKRLDSVYVGGGTPTTLSAEELDRLLNTIKKYFDLSRINELTVEAGRPDSITEEKLMVLKNHQVDRISINPQTMNDETLKRIGRHHNSDQIRESFLLARKIGFTNINMDIILGLPGETEKEIKHTLEEIRKLSPDSLTVHSLAVKRASALSGWLKENGYSEIKNDSATMDMCSKAAGEMNLLPYYLYRQKNISGNLENVGFAKEGCFGVYNILMMEEVQTIVACGAGTVTKRVYGDGRIERCDNVKDVALYISKIEEMIDRKRGLFKD